MPFFICGNGDLWKEGDADNLRYARYEGRLDRWPHEPIWVYRRSNIPDEAIEITVEQAVQFMPFPVSFLGAAHANPLWTDHLG